MHAAAALSVLVGTQAAKIGDTILDPRTYVSRSGEYALFVDPSRPTGAGAGRYRFTRGGEELWSGSRPWTLREAEVTDDGLVAGYAYGAGPRGGEDDSLTIVLLEADGKARLEERMKREGVTSCDTSPEPTVNGIFLDPDHARMVVRFQPGFFRSSEDWKLGESWLTYALSSGAAGPPFRPKAALPEDERLGPISAARALPGSGLVLVHWTWYDHDTLGSVFTLHDENGALRWRLDWPSEVSGTDSRSPESQLWQELRARGAILAVEEPGRFTLGRAATRERVSFEARQSAADDGNWEVRETARAPFVELADARPPLAEHAATLPRLAFHHLGTIVLGDEAAPVPSPDVIAFDIDGLGRVGTIRRRGNRFLFSLQAPDGATLHSLELPCIPGKTAWVGDERWVVTGLCSDDPEHAKGFWIDPVAETVSPTADLGSTPVQALAGTGDGGFVTLGRLPDVRSWTPLVRAFDGRGERRWSLSEDGTMPDSSLFAPQSVTVTSDGRVVVVDAIRDLLQIFSRDGEFLRAVDLKKAWSRDPNFPAGVEPDLDGGLLVHDFNGSPPIVCMDREDHVTDAFQPRYAAARAFRIVDSVKAGPDGLLWTSDGYALLVLDRQGIARRVLGSAPDASVLGRIVRLVVGPADQLYAADLHSCSVHVFDAAGRHLRVLRPDAQDFSDDLFSPSLTVNDEGEVFLGELVSSNGGPKGHVCFDASGTRRGIVPCTLEGESERWYAQPGTKCRWVVGRSVLLLVAQDGSRLRTVERRPDGRWLRNIGEASVAANGSIAFAVPRPDGLLGSVDLFDAAGDPLRSVTLTSGVSWGPFAFDGEHLAFGTYGGESAPGTVVLVDSSGTELGSFTPEPSTSWAWRPYFSADGSELWLFDGGRRIERYRRD